MTTLYMNTMTAAAQSSLVKIPSEMPIFLREYSSNMYGTVAYFIARLIVEIPLYVILAGVSMILPYFFVGLSGNFMMAWAINFLAVLCGSSLGVFLSCLGGKNPMRVVVWAPFFLATLPWAYAGVYRSLLEIPGYLKPLQYLVPFRYVSADAAWFELKEDLVEPHLPDEARKALYKEAAKQWFALKDITADSVWYYYFYALFLFLVYRVAAWGLLWRNSQSLF
jgi:hypothetical protein